MRKATKNPQNSGVITLIIAITAFVLSLIPCIGFIAIIPGIIAIVLPIIRLPHAKKENAPRGMLVSGFIIAIIAVMISFAQIFIIQQITKNVNSMPKDIQEMVDEWKGSIKEEAGSSIFPDM